MPRFRLKRIGLILAAAAAGGAAVWFFFFPVPVGGLLRFAAGRAGADGPGGTVLLERATFRWCWGEPAVRLDVAGLAVRRGGEPLADVAALAVELEKRAWWRSGYAPSRVGLKGARLAIDLRPAASGTPAQPSGNPLATLEPALAPLGALWPREGAATVVNADGLRAVLRTAAGTAEWQWARLQVRARRAGDGLEISAEAALAGDGAPRADVSVRHVPAMRRLTAVLRVPRFSTAALPPWPGAAALPLRAQVEVEAEVEVETGTGRISRGKAALTVTDATVTLPDLAAPIPVPRAALRLRAEGDPVRIELEEARIEVSGASLAAERVVAVLGEAPRLEGGAVLENVSAAAWVALLPVEVRQQLPVRAEAVADLWLRRATVRGAVELRAPRDGTWNPRALKAEGEIVAANAGRELTATWQAAQGDDGVTTVRAVLAPVNFAEWGGALAKDSAAAALQLPVAVQGEVTIEAVGEVRSAAMEITAGPGRIGAWGPLPQPVGIKHAALRAELAEAGRRVRIPHLKIETDGPALEIADAEAAWPRDQPVTVRGRGRLSALGAAWAEPWLPKGTLAPLANFGLEPKDARIAEVSATWEGAATAAGGAWKPTAGAVKVETQLALRGTLLPLRADARWRPTDGRAEIEVHAGPFEPAALPIKLPAGVPALSHFALPVSLRAAAQVGLDGVLAGLRFGFEAGSGTVRALPQWPVDLPVQKISVAGEASADGKRATVETVAVEFGAGLTLSGRNLAWTEGAPPTVSGDLSFGAAALPALLPLLAPEVARAVRGYVQAAELGGARVRFAASPDEKAPFRWRIAELRADATLAGIAATVPEVGKLGLARATLEADYPRVRVTLGGAAAPEFFRGTADVRAEVDVTQPDALRGTLRIEAPHARLVAPEMAVVPLLGAPLQVDAVQAGPGKIEFSAESAVALGRKLRANGRMETGPDGAQSIELARLEFGATALGATLREAPGQARAVRVRGARLALDELLETAAPFLPPPAAAASAAGDTKTAGDAKKQGAEKRAPDAGMDLEVEFDAVTLGGGKALGALRASARLRDGWPERAEFSAKEGAGNALRFTLGEGAGGAAQPLALEVDDASAWLAALTGPLKGLPLPADQAATLATVAQVPVLMAGGRVEVAGELAARSRFDGRVSVGQATIVRAPRILQLLALKSGKALAQQPLLERLAVARVTADERMIALDGVTLAGTGLIDRLKLNSARYEIPTQKVAADGLYFGVGFEVVGTRAEPQVFLKDNSLLVRTVGQRNEFDFEAMASEAAEAKAKANAAKKP